jgi:hypothetical protein
MIRRVSVLAALLGLSLPLKADPRRCIADHEQGQVLRNETKLVEARHKFLSCSTESGCPPIVSKECAAFLGAVDRDLPTLVFSATDPEGGDAQSVSVYVDGRLVSERLDGRSIAVDPGPHALRFVDRHGNQRELSIVVAQGQKNVAVSADFRAPRSEAEPAPTGEPGARGIPTASLAFGAIGLAALGSFAYFGLDGRSRESDLRDCKPYCTQEQADAMQRSYLLADLSLGVAVVSFGAAVWIALDDTSSADAARSSFKLGARALGRGAALALSGGF